MSNYTGFEITSTQDGDLLTAFPHDKIDVISEFMHEKDIRFISVTGIDDVEFLKTCTFIEGIILLGVPKNYEAIYELKNLRKINIYSDKDFDFCFDNFDKLQSCFIENPNRVNALFDCLSLEELTVGGYKSEDLGSVGRLINLKRLDVRTSSIRSLEGIAGLKCMELLELNYLKNLRILSELGELHQLKKLSIVNCPKISSIEDLRHLTNLEFVRIDNCKNIESIKPLNDLDELQTVHLLQNTNVVDGDMTPLLKRKDALFGSRKHYSHNNDEIDEFNGTKRPWQTWDI